MKIFEIEIQEYLSRVISIEAVNHDDAISKVKEKYRKEEIVLDYDDFVEVQYQLLANSFCVD